MNWMPIWSEAVAIYEPNATSYRQAERWIRNSTKNNNSGGVLNINYSILLHVVCLKIFQGHRAPHQNYHKSGPPIRWNSQVFDSETHFTLSAARSTTPPHLPSRSSSAHRVAEQPLRSNPMAEAPSIHRTEILKQIAVDYCPEVCHHSPDAGEIHVTYDHRDGARWRSPARFCYGTFGARIRCPAGNTSGLNFNIYLSSLEGDKSQDEIDFEFLGKDKTSVQTNFYTTGTGGREIIHPLGFDASEDFHEYLIRWEPDRIEWLVDGAVIREEVRKDGDTWPEKPMFLYASVWDASYIDEGRWTGQYIGCDAPYVCSYKDVRVPIESIVIEEEEEGK